MPVQPPKYIPRFRVRSGSKQWNDKGPDLLRSRKSAKRQLNGIVHDIDKAFWVKVNDHDWKKVGGRMALMESFEAWGGAEFRVGVKDGDSVRLIAMVKRERVPYVILNNCSPDTSIGWSLAHYQFPDALFAGGYVWKQVKGSDSWSDHAWGTAFDMTRNGKDQMPEMTDWFSRMARENCIKFDYALGTLDGKQVVYINGDSGNVRDSSASTSHLWHIHCSVVDHDGRKPPQQGGVW